LATLHSSLTHWKNLFSFELMGEDGYFAIDGLGTSYGTERLIIGKRDFTAPFQDHVIEYRGGDSSWQSEWREFKAAIAENRTPLGKRPRRARGGARHIWLPIRRTIQVGRSHSKLRQQAIVGRPCG